MLINTIQIVLDINGNLIDKVYKPIRSLDQNNYTVQIVSPNLATGIFDLTLSAYTHQNIQETVRLELARDAEQTYLKGSDVIDPQKSYYTLCSDYNVWERPIIGKAVSVLQKINGHKLGIVAQYGEFVQDANALVELGTFGSPDSNVTTIYDLPTPTTENIGDYYTCGVLGFTSTSTGIDFSYGEIAYYNGTSWILGRQFILGQPAPIVYITIDPSLSLEYEGVDLDQTQQIVTDLATVDGTVSNLSGRVSQTEQDILDLELGAIDVDANNINYDNVSSGLTAINIQDAIDELDTNIENIALTGTADGITYDNNNSGLLAINVQTAIDEVESRIDSIEQSPTIGDDTDLVVNATTPNLGVHANQELLNEAIDNKFASVQTDIDDNTTHSTSDGKTHSDVLLNNAHRVSDGKDHTDVLQNTTHRTTTTGNPHNVTKTDVGLANVDNTSDIDKPISTATQAALDIKADLVGGLIPQSQLPSYVDDVEEYVDLAGFPVTGEAGKIYVALDTYKIYRWASTVYVEISDALDATEVKSLYESNADTNVFTDVLLTKLNGIATGAEVNDPNTTLQGNTFNGNSQLVQTTADGKLPVISGANLTDVASQIPTSDTPPVSPIDGDLWWDSINGKLKIYYEDVDTGQWVVAMASNFAANSSKVTIEYDSVLISSDIATPTNIDSNVSFYRDSDLYGEVHISLSNLNNSGAYYHFDQENGSGNDNHLFYVSKTSDSVSWSKIGPDLSADAVSEGYLYIPTTNTEYQITLQNNASVTYVKKTYN